jgi:hypothetical protein
MKDSNLTEEKKKETTVSELPLLTKTEVYKYLLKCGTYEERKFARTQLPPNRYKLLKDYPLPGHDNYVLPKGTEFVFRSPMYIHKQSGTYFLADLVENKADWFELIPNEEDKL